MTNPEPHITSSETSAAKPAPPAPGDYQPSAPRYASTPEALQTPSGPPISVKPRNPYILSVISLFFPGGTLAIPALVNAAAINDLTEDGNFTRAQRKSDSAVRWLLASWTINILFILLMILALILQPIGVVQY